MVELIYDKTIPVQRKEYIHYNNRCAMQTAFAVITSKELRNYMSNAAMDTGRYRRLYLSIAI